MSAASDLKAIAHGVAAAAAREVGAGAVVIVMVADNSKPHSKHFVAWKGSCLEVRGLLAQGSEVVEAVLRGTLHAESD